MDPVHFFHGLDSRRTVEESIALLLEEFKASPEALSSFVSVSGTAPNRIISLTTKLSNAATADSLIVVQTFDESLSFNLVLFEAIKNEAVIERRRIDYRMHERILFPQRILWEKFLKLSNQEGQLQSSSEFDLATIKFNALQDQSVYGYGGLGAKPGDRIVDQLELETKAINEDLNAVAISEFECKQPAIAATKIQAQPRNKVTKTFLFFRLLSFWDLSACFYS